jgi:hypothetical protein
VISSGIIMRENKFWAKVLGITLILAFAWSCGSGEKVPLVVKKTIKKLALWPRSYNS